jgi:hypothetical protein
MKLNGLILKNIEGVNLPNDVVSAIAVQSSATWGLDRSDQIWYEHGTKYRRDGNNVDVYIGTQVLLLNIDFVSAR